MSLVIHAHGMKGAAARSLRRAVDQKLAEVGDLLTADQVEGVHALTRAANALISRTPKGKQVSIQLLLTDAPFGGVDYSVAVTASMPRSR